MRDHVALRMAHRIGWKNNSGEMNKQQKQWTASSLSLLEDRRGRTQKPQVAACPSNIVVVQFFFRSFSDSVRRN